jgi:hypothetical protein
MIHERDITAPKPSLLKEEEFAVWVFDEVEPSPDHHASRCITNLRYMTTIFQTACPTLDKMSEVSLNHSHGHVVDFYSYGPNSELSFHEKEELATKTYLSLTEQYSKLPSFLKMPHSAKTARPAHIYSLQ